MEVGINKEIKVGLLAITTSAILYFGFLFLKGKSLFTINNIYYTKYERNKGIKVSNSILINDYVVGNVKDIKILPEENFSTLVTFEIQKNIQVTDKSEVKLINVGLMGERALELSIHPGAPLASHSMIPGGIDPSADTTIQLVTDKMKVITDNAEKTIEAFNTLITKITTTNEALHEIIDENKENIHHISKNIADISNVLSNRKSGIGPVLSTMNRVFHDLENLQLTKIACKTDSILDRMHSIISGIQDKKGSLGLFLYDNTLYNNLNNNLVHLDKLLLDIKRNPRAYLNFSVFNFTSKKHLTQ